MIQEGSILICDDNAFVLQMIRFVLEAEGYTAETATSTDEIIQKLENRHLPSLIFLDLNIPVAGGEFIMRHLKSQEKFRDIPVILFSGEEDLKETASRLKADDVLQKPFENKDLKALVQKFLPKK